VEHVVLHARSPANVVLVLFVSFPFFWGFFSKMERTGLMKGRSGFGAVFMTIFPRRFLVFFPFF